LDKLKLVAKRLKKPLMVDVGTQTELTMIDLEEMENNIKSLSDRLTTTEIVDKNSRGGKDILDRLEVIELGIARMEEDKIHNQTQGNEMRIQLTNLELERKRFEKMLNDERNNVFFEPTCWRCLFSPLQRVQ
ncbi:27468_t:CDS:1, partial [Racocetra persica]